jgi:hypothetical protein
MLATPLPAGASGLTVPMATRLAPLRHLVRGVVRARAKKQMLRTNARRIVATVEDAKLTSRTVGEFPRHAVSALDASPPYGSPNLPVTHRVSICGPDPAPAELWNVLGGWAVAIDLAPEALLEEFLCERRRLALATLAESRAALPAPGLEAASVGAVRVEILERGRLCLKTLATLQRAAYRRFVNRGHLTNGPVPRCANTPGTLS